MLDEDLVEDPAVDLGLGLPIVGPVQQVDALTDRLLDVLGAGLLEEGVHDIRGVEIVEHVRCGPGSGLVQEVDQRHVVGCEADAPRVHLGVLHRVVLRLDFHPRLVHEDATLRMDDGGMLARLAESDGRLLGRVLDPDGHVGGDVEDYLVVERQSDEAFLHHHRGDGLVLRRRDGGHGGHRGERRWHEIGVIRRRHGHVGRVVVVIVNGRWRRSSGHGEIVERRQRRESPEEIIRLWNAGHKIRNCEVGIVFFFAKFIILGCSGSTDIAAAVDKCWLRLELGHRSRQSFSLGVGVVGDFTKDGRRLAVGISRWIIEAVVVALGNVDI